MLKRCPLNSIEVRGRDFGASFGLGALVDGDCIVTHPDVTMADAIGPAFATWPDASPDPHIPDPSAAVEGE